MERLESTTTGISDQGLSMVSGQSAIVNSSSTNNSQSVTPLRRPQPLLATAFSFDSGFEVSPICLYSFQYGESMPSNMMINGSLVSGKNTGDSENGSVQDNAGETLLTQEDIEGVDDELISIDQHFTPIHSPASVAGTKKLKSTAIPTMAEKSKTAGGNNNPNVQQHRRQAFNLALQRRENRLNQINLLGGNSDPNNNNNNNDPYFPNAYGDAQDLDLFEFDRDIDDIDEDYDDVFFEDSGADTSCLYTTQPMQQHPRPSCVMMFGGLDHEDESEQEEIRECKEDDSKSDFFDVSSGSSHSSSTPIPIPGAISAANKHLLRPKRDRRSSLQFFKDDADLDGDMVDGNSLGRYSYPEYSLPDGRRMPYYHHMAPRLGRLGDDSPLLIDPQPETIQSISPIHQQSSSSPPTRANSTSKFGSRLAVSFSMIRGNREPTCYSPPPLFGNHPMNDFLFRFDRLEPNRYGGNRALPLFGSSMLAPHPELHEDEADDDDHAMAQDPWTRARSPSILQFPMSPPTPKLVESAEELGEQEKAEDQVTDPATVVVQQQQLNLIGQNSRSTTLINVDVIPPIDRGQPQCSCNCGCRCYCCGRSPSPCITQPVIETVAFASRSTPLPDVVFNCQRKVEPQSMLPLPSTLPQTRSEQSAQNAQQSTNRQQLKRSNTDYYSDHNYHSVRYRNTLPLFPQVPSLNHPQPDSSHYYNNYPNGTIYHNYHNGQIEQRRTMSVSLPIDQETIAAAGRKLRQISTEFHLLQLQRSASFVRQNYHRPRPSIGRVVQQSIDSSPTVIVAASPNNAEIDAHDNEREDDSTAHSNATNNAVSFLRTFLELLRLSPTINIQNHSSNNDNAQRRGGRRNRSRRPMPATSNSSTAVPRQVNNSIFYIGQPAAPQTSNSPNTSAAGDSEVI